MKKSQKLALVSLLVVGLLVTCFIGSVGARTLRLASNSPYNSPTTRAMEYFAELVEKKTDGELKINIFPANELGANREMVEGLELGAIDIMIQGSSLYAILGAEEYGFMRIMYMFRNQDHVHRVYGGEIGEELAQKVFNETGIRVISQNWDRLPRHVSGNKPIWGVEDIQRMKVRNGDFVSVEGFKLMGANPVNIPLNEMYLALQQGAADGANLPLDFYYDHSLYEVQEYLSLMYHTYDVQIVSINENTFQSLSKDLQEALLEAVEEAAEYNNTLTWELEEDYIANLQREGMKLILTNKDEFIQHMAEKVDEIYKLFPEVEEGFYERVQAYQ